MVTHRKLAVMLIIGSICVISCLQASEPPTALTALFLSDFRCPLPLAEANTKESAFHDFPLKEPTAGIGLHSQNAPQNITQNQWMESPNPSHVLPAFASSCRWPFNEPLSLYGKTSLARPPAAVISGSARANAQSDHWNHMTRFDPAVPGRPNREQSFVFDSGFRFGPGIDVTANDKFFDAEEYDDGTTENELTVFIGQNASSAFGSASTRAYAGEYRRGLLAHLDGTVSAVYYEGASQVARRSGATIQLWAVTTLVTQHFSFGAGVGPYFFLDKKHSTGNDDRTSAAIAPLVSLTLSAQISPRCVVRIVFDRVTANNNRDANLFLLGLGCRWPR